MSLQNQITSKLKQEFDPIQLKVTNESHQHNVPPGSESHFHVYLVSDQFERESLVGRHQAVYAVLSEEMRSGVHALRLQIQAPSEVPASGVVLPKAPKCMGGSKKP